MEVAREGSGNLKVESRAPCVVPQEKLLEQKPHLLMAAVVGWHPGDFQITSWSSEKVMMALVFPTVTLCKSQSRLPSPKTLDHRFPECYLINI